MTEKAAVPYPPLSDEDLARYGGPPELGYLPMVNMANELIAARALAKRGPFTTAALNLDAALVRERAMAERLDASTAEVQRLTAALQSVNESFGAEHANAAHLRAEVERLTADLVECDAKRRRAVADADEQLRLHAETHKLLIQSNADHNALLLHLHAIREAAGIPAGPEWGVVVAAVSARLRELLKLEASRNWAVQGEWQRRLASILGSPDTRDHIEAAAVDARSEIARLTRLKDELLGRLEALCHRLDDNDVKVGAETWVEHLEAGIAKLIEQRDGACARREAEETTRIKADAQAVFEAQRTDLATAIGVGPVTRTGEPWDWNALVRRCVDLRREHAEYVAANKTLHEELGQRNTELAAIDLALFAGLPFGHGRAGKIRANLEWTVKMRGEVQDATKKLCKALGIADTATLGFAVETAVERIETGKWIVIDDPLPQRTADPGCFAADLAAQMRRERKLASGLAPTSRIGIALDRAKERNADHQALLDAMDEIRAAFKLGKGASQLDVVERVRAMIAHAERQRGDLAQRLRDSDYIRKFASWQGDGDWLADATDAELLDQIIVRLGEADRQEAELHGVREVVSIEKLGGSVTMLADGWSLREMVSNAIARAEQNGRAEGKRESTAAVAKLQLVREALGAVLLPDGIDDVVERARARQTELGEARQRLVETRAEYDKLIEGLRHQLELARADREQAEQDAEAGATMIARGDRLRDRIKALEEHNREMFQAVSAALGRLPGSTSVGWKDLIAAIEQLRAQVTMLDARERETHAMVAASLGRSGVEADVGWPVLYAAIERQGADLREAKQNADAACEALQAERERTWESTAKYDALCRKITEALGGNAS